MAQWYKVATASQTPTGTSRELTAGGRVVALFHVDGKFYALDGICPHAGGPLGEGALCGQIVTCPWHGWQFDVTTGRHALNSRIEHTRFAVKVDGDDVYVEIP